MTNLVTFVPQADLDAQANLAAFIDLCRARLTVFGQSLDFEADSWDVSDTIKLAGKVKRLRLIYSNLDTCNEPVRVMMREPFKSFAKSYMRYEHGMSPTHDVGKRILALRALEAALLETGTADPVRIDSHVLNRAAQRLGERTAPTTAYRTSGQLEKISNFLCDNRLIALPNRWRNPLRRPSDAVRVGKEADDRRAAKMPSQAALDALPEVFQLATSPGDVLVSSVVAILCSAPDRISEVLQLPVNCEVRQKREGSEETAYGLRWWPAKGAAPMVKWVVPTMTGVVEAAIAKIRRLTDEARDVARWYEEHPTQLYLTEDMEHLRTQEWLSMAEVADIVFAEPVHPSSSRIWCDANQISKQKRGGYAYVRFADVEAVVLRQLPRGFPVAAPKTGLLYSNALFVIQRNALHPRRARFRCIIEPVTDSHIHPRLGSGPSNGILSIFDHCGFYEPDGSPIRVHTHQFRHYLNTLAQAGGLSQLDIAKWSGRKDVRQNRYYDHETPAAVVARIRTAVGDDTRMFGPLATGPRAALITRDEFARLKVPTAHTTDFGYCIHDYVMSPCQMHRDCLNCGEQVCVKGESDKENRIRQAHAEATRLLAMAERADADGELGAGEWAKHHRAQLARITALLDILDDPVVARGAVIQLMPADMPSRLEQATQARALLPSQAGGDSAPTFEEAA
ncbi:integrase [Burkholderia pseudomallei]|uniref:integrase n=1 Tax=Burkholderia pseudomallei TaxID=28450 RepID=UPI0005CA159D|nr:integrase [Burkholderia pseudomallei]